MVNFSGFKRIKIGVIGDLIFDHYIFGTVNRISPEAPVPVVRVTKETSFLGGASNVARNLTSLGIDTYLFGVVGNDSYGDKLLHMVEKANIATDNIIRMEHRPTTVKTRVIAHSQQVVRFDKEVVLNLEKKHTKAILNSVKKLQLDAVIVSDYGKGVVTRGLIDGLVKMNKFVSVDPKVHNAYFYKNVNIITPNLKEAKEISNVEIDSFVNGVEIAAKKILEETDADYILITRGQEGMTLFSKDGDIYQQKAKAKEVYDVTGAGDTVIAVLTACAAAGFNIKQAVKIANIAAGIVVGKMGTATLSLDEIESKLSL